MTATALFELARSTNDFSIWTSARQPTKNCSSAVFPILVEKTSKEEGRGSDRETYSKPSPSNKVINRS